MEPQAIVELFRRNVMEHYVDFEGRVGRPEFWYYVLAYVLLFVIVAIVQSVFRTHALTHLLYLALLLPTMGMGVRRLHDIDRTGWWVLLGVVPSVVLVISAVTAFFVGGLGTMLFASSLLSLVMLLAAILLIYWYAQPGTTGPNEYGPEPQAITPPATVA